MAGAGDLSAQYDLVTRTLSSGVERVYPMLPSGQSSGLPAPISHLSWAPNGTELAVSIAAIQDNEGWQIALLDTATAQNYLGGTGVTPVPMTGPDRRRSYWREGVYLPDGNLFVSRACCAGEPVRNVSKLMWEITPAGVLRHQVAIGFPGLDHTSLAVNHSGKWLLYLAGTGLYVSEKGGRPAPSAPASSPRPGCDPGARMLRRLALISAAGRHGTWRMPGRYTVRRLCRAWRAAGTRGAMRADIRASASAQPRNWASSSSSSCSRMAPGSLSTPPSKTKFMIACGRSPAAATQSTTRRSPAGMSRPSSSAISRAAH